jgi:hypothetical protein
MRIYEERTVPKNMALLDAQISGKGLKAEIYLVTDTSTGPAKPRENAVLRDLLSDTFLVIIGVCG